MEQAIDDDGDDRRPIVAQAATPRTTDANPLGRSGFDRAPRRARRRRVNRSSYVDLRLAVATVSERRSIRKCSGFGRGLPGT